MKYSLLQWNVLYQEKANNIIALIKQLQPDIICAQELTKHSEANSHIDIPKLVEGLGYEGYFETTIGRDDFVMGNGIFSKLPIKNKTIQFTQLSDGSGSYDKETRAYLESDLETQNGVLTVGTVHLSYTHEFISTPLRDQENERLISFVSDHKEKFVFCGDFNATPESSLISSLSKSFRDAGPDYSEKTWTTKPFSYKGFEATTLDWRLDYVFATPDVKIVSSNIIQTAYSDHLPILVEFEA